MSSSNLRRALTPIAFIFGSLALLTVAYIQLRSGTQSHPAHGPKVGEVIDDAKIQFWKGEAHSLQHYLNETRRKVVLINFWATWCQPCLVEMPSLNRAWEILKPEGLEVLAINVEVNADAKIQRIVNRFKLGFPIISERGEWSQIFDVEVLPTSVLLDSDLKVLAYWVGEREWDSKRVLAELRAALGAQANR